jgi:hypothetical protein
MKTAVSIPDQVFRSAEALARRLGMTRSALYAEALRSFIAERARADVTRRLDDVYDAVPSGADAALSTLQMITIERRNEDDEW